MFWVEDWEKTSLCHHSTPLEAMAMDESQVHPYRRPVVSGCDEVFASIW